MLMENSRIQVVPITRDNMLSFYIKAGKFLLGNAILTLCLAVVVLSEIFLMYLLIAKSVNIPLLIPAFTLLVIAIIARICLWYFFGKELIEVRGNCLYVKRSYGLYTSKEKYISLDGLASGEIDLYVNKSDNWNWNNMEEKGIFRFVKDREILNFGIKLNDNEYEMLLFQLNKLLNKYKKTPVQPPPIASELSTPLPSLDIQLNGKHIEKLNAFFNKSYDLPASQEGIKDEKEDKKSKTQKTSAKG